MSPRRIPLSLVEANRPSTQNRRGRKPSVNDSGITIKIESNNHRDKSNEKTVLNRSLKTGNSLISSKAISHVASRDHFDRKKAKVEKSYNGPRLVMSEEDDMILPRKAPLSKSRLQFTYKETNPPMAPKGKSPAADTYNQMEGTEKPKYSSGKSIGPKLAKFDDFEDK